MTVGGLRNRSAIRRPVDRVTRPGPGPRWKRSPAADTLPPQSVHGDRTSVPSRHVDHRLPLTGGRHGKRSRSHVSAHRSSALQFRDNARRGVRVATALPNDGPMTAAPPVRLLVLEDDEGLRTSLRLVLEADGYDVVEAGDAEVALGLVDAGGIDLMLVDLMLTGMDGFTFIRRVRPLTPAPIVVVSARDGVQDVVAALEAGADDYVTKPFVVEEVQARLRALLRRPALAVDSPVAGADDSFVLDGLEGPLVFDRRAAVLSRGEEQIHLTSTEFRLLGVLVDHAGQVLARTALLEHVWEHGYFGDERIVDVHVRRLRKKLELDPASPATLVTVRGLGYRLDVR